MKKGFTLIETFVAISILLVSLAGPLSIAAKALQSAYYSRDEIIASYLAQEAIEFVRAIRDENYLAGNPGWLNSLDGTGGLPNCIDATCTIDFPHFKAAACPGPDACPVLLIDTNGLYNQQPGNGNPSIYTRAVTIKSVAGRPDEIDVEVKVSWRTGTIERQFTISDHLFNWL
jgi:prepilin-type N-terminal cleavage/methylation domain-containing protein